jgi:uncharacterized protein YcaQ
VTGDVSVEEARRIAVHAQLLDGSATDVLETVQRLGFLQIDPINTVATPQRLVLFSRLGPYDVAELDRLLWDEKRLFEWNAFIWPIESLPLIQARMRRWKRRPRGNAWERKVDDWMTAQRPVRRYVLKELEQGGPLLARELEDRSGHGRRDHRWWGARHVIDMLDWLHRYGEVAIVGRREGQRVWDLAGRWYPATKRVSLEEAEARLDEQRFRSLGVRLVRGRLLVHPEADASPVPDRITVLSPFDRLVHDRNRAEAVFGFRYRLEMYVPKAKREYGYYVLPLLAGDRIVGRIEPRFDRQTRRLELLGGWGDTSRLNEALASLGAFLGAEAVESGVGVRS